MVSIDCAILVLLGGLKEATNVLKVAGREASILILFYAHAHADTHTRARSKALERK